MKKNQIIKFIFGLFIAFMVVGCDSESKKSVSKPKETATILDFSGSRMKCRASIAKVALELNNIDFIDFMVADKVAGSLSGDYDSLDKYNGMTAKEFIKAVKEEYPKDFQEVMKRADRELTNEEIKDIRSLMRDFLEEMKVLE